MPPAMTDLLDDVRTRIAERRDRRLAPERDAVAALDWAADPPLALEGIELEWLGTAGFRLTAEGTTVLVDPYVSRPGWRAVAFDPVLRAVDRADRRARAPAPTPSSWVTPTSTTPSTSRPSPGATGPPCTARGRCTT